MAATKKLSLRFPLKGLVEGTSYVDQPRGTTPFAVNCMAFDPRTGRNRGGSRSGSSRYCPDRANGAAAIQNLQAVSVLLPLSDLLLEDESGAILMEDGSPILLEGSAAMDFGERRVSLVAVAGGTVSTMSRTGRADVTDGTEALAIDRNVITSIPFFGKIYYADGQSEKFYDSSLNSMVDWVPTAGTLPVDSEGNKPTLITAWGNRIVMAGLPEDSHNWFMSASGDPLDWDYSPATITVGQAVAGNNASAGLNPDIVTALVPYTNDILLFGGDHTIYQLRGNPADGGRIDLLSDITGMAFGEAWCKTPEGVLYFIGSRGGLYRMVPGEAPQRMTAFVLDELLATINMAANSIKLCWDDRHVGVRILITPFPVDGEVQGDAEHFFWDARNEGFWPFKFANRHHSPLSILLFDGPDPNDRAVLIGGQDGYLRQLDVTRGDDDGETIDSAIVVAKLDSLCVLELQATLSKQSGFVRWTLHEDSDLETALSEPAVAHGTLGCGRNASVWPRRHVDQGWLKLSSQSPWSFESIDLFVSADSRTRQRVS